MACSYVYAKVGNKYVLTALGAEVSRVRSKYEQNYPDRQHYEKVVPSIWVKNEYVVEVPDGTK